MLFSVVVVALALAFTGGVFIYPFVCSKLSQRKAVKRLLKDAESMGYKHRKFYKNIFTVRNLSYKYDMLLYNEDKTYAVKLWNAKHILSTLVLTDGGTVFERRKTVPVIDTSRANELQLRGRAGKVPKTRLPKKYAKNENLKEVLLVYPPYKEIIYEGRGGRIILNTGDELFDKELLSPSAFAAELTYEAQKGTV
ncbi:MAG: hypothetical protein E7607_04490 [Ruminococcaceae bacterium]|nr:hypothetical protein [Oscillospiraceae bacterium]